MNKSLQLQRDRYYRMTFYIEMLKDYTNPDFDFTFGGDAHDMESNKRSVGFCKYLKYKFGITRPCLVLHFPELFSAYLYIQPYTDKSFGDFWFDKFDKESRISCLKIAIHIGTKQFELSNEPEPEKTKKQKRAIFKAIRPQGPVSFGEIGRTILKKLKKIKV